MKSFRSDLSVSLVLTVFVLGIFSCTPTAENSSPAPSAEVAPIETPTVPSGNPYAVLETAKGDITVRLLPEVAPASVANFIELAEVGFYNRTSFHRIMKDLMIQGGDPLSKDNNPYNDGQGQGSRLLPQEFSDTRFDRGTVAMGRSPDGGDGGSCQFFIVLKRAPDWDGKYNVFGKVVDGIDIADQISRAALSKDSHPSMKYRPAGKQIIKKIRIEYREDGDQKEQG